jgi:ammonium transporter, Amt family
VGGLVGMIMTALLANVAVNAANTTGNGLFFGDTALFLVHMKALVIVVAFTFGGAYLILQITNLIMPMKVTEADKKVGQDFSQHGENVYPVELSLSKDLN